MPIPEHRLEFKERLFAKSREFHSRSIKAFPGYVKGINADDLVSGRCGIYIKPVLRDSDNKILYWTIFDVEGSDHFNLDQNIGLAKEFLTWCIENDLTEGLQIILTGNGFRFCWPWIVPKNYKKAFKAMVDDLARYIDGDVFRKKSFLRLYMYRGHKSQEKKDLLKDVHLHLLPDPHHLWLMDADKYRKLIAGKPDGDFMSWLPKILPRDLPPAPWFTVLDEYKRQLRLKESIFDPAWSKPTNVSYKAAWEQIDAYLSQQGITKRAVQIGGGQTIYRLSECPMCHRKDANPFLTESGRLKDWHKNSCDAGKIDEQGNLIGLRPSEWVPDYQGADAETVFEDTEDGKTVDEAREDIADAVNGNADILIISTPGTGKTTTTSLEIIPTCTDRKVLYIGPTKKLSGEVVEKAQEIADQHGVNIHWLRGREGNEDGREPTCYNIPAVKKIQKRGFSPSMLFCPKCAFFKKPQTKAIIKDGQRVEVLNDDRCPYQKQFDEMNKPGFFISTHAQSQFLGEHLSKFDTVIIDENPAPVFMDKSWTGKDAVDKFQAGMSQANKDVFGKTHDELIKQLEALQEKGSGHARIYATEPPAGSQWEGQESLWERAGITDAERESLASDLAGYDQWEGESLYHWQRRLYKEHINLNALTWLWAALGYRTEYTAYIYVSLPSKSNPFKFVCFKKNVPDFTGRLILLDGTGDKAEMDALFDRNFDLVDADVHMPDCKKVWIQQALGKMRTGKLDDEQIRKLLSKAVSQLKPTDKTVLIGTFKGIKERVLNIARGLMPDKQVEAVHFYGNRGINEFEGFDAFIDFGTPNVNHNSVLDESMVLFEDSEAQQRWRDNIGKSELIQTLHRIRPVNGGKTIIIMGREWPSKLGRPDGYIDCRRTDRKGTKGQESQKMAQAYERLKWFVSEFGFISKDIAFFLGVGCVRGKDSMETVELYHEHFMHSVKNSPPDSNDKKVDTCLIYNTLLSMYHLFSPCYFFKRVDAWDNFIEKLQAEFPELPQLETKQGPFGGKWVKGLGYLENVKDFYAGIGKTDKFEPDKWQGIEQPEHDQDDLPSEITQQIESEFPEQENEDMTARSIRRAKLKKAKKQARKVIRQIKSHNAKCSICGGTADTMGIHSDLTNGIEIGVYPVCSHG